MLNTVGYLEGKTFIFPIRVYFEDTDAGGLVYHSNYLKYMERGRTEMSRHLHVSHSENFNRGQSFFVVRKLEIEYLKAARLDDILEVHTTFTHMTPVRLNATQDIYRGQVLVASSKVFLASVDQTGKPARINETFYKTLKHSLAYFFK